MAIDAVASNNVPAAPPARAPEAKQVVDRPVEKKAAPPPAPAPQPQRPVVNTSGQTTGTRINTSA